MSDNIRVTIAAVVGTVAPATGWFMDNVEPILKSLLLAGQIGVAVVTILYIYRKWQNARKNKDDSEE